MASSNLSAQVCIICGHEELTDEDMRAHMKTHEVEQRCPMCKFREVMTAAEMEKHVNRCHLDGTSPGKNASHSRPLWPSSNAALDNNYTNYVYQNEAEIMDESLKLKWWEARPDANKRSRMQNDLFICMLCNQFETDTPEAMQLHMEHVHFRDDKKTGQSSNNTSGQALTTDDNISQVCEQGIDAVANIGNNCEETSKDVRKINNTCPKSDKENSTAGCKIKSSVEISKAQKDDTNAESNRNDAPKEDKFYPVRRETEMEVSIDCPVCDLTLPSKTTIEEHFDQCHQEYVRAAKAVEEGEVGPSLICPVCYEPQTDPSTLQTHVDSHFKTSIITGIPTWLQTLPSGELESQEKERREKHATAFKQGRNPPQPATSKSGNGAATWKRNDGTEPKSKQLSMLDFCPKEQKNAILNKNNNVDDCSTNTTGIIEKLHAFYAKPNKQLKKYWLASPSDHYSGATFDRGWGCGYRNFQMLLSCLKTNPDYHQIVFNGKLVIPSVSMIQQLIELAWARGFDPQGMKQMKGRVVNTKKWIGATELFAVLASLNVKCQLVDFYRTTGPDGTHPRMFEWVKNYFCGGGFKPPLYLQHHGHSRSIVGVEEDKDGTIRLLLFDPGTPRCSMQPFIRRDINVQLMRTIRRHINGMKAKQYQILAVRGILSDREQEQYKLLRSDRVP